MVQERNQRKHIVRETVGGGGLFETQVEVIEREVNVNDHQKNKQNTVLNNKYKSIEDNKGDNKYERNFKKPLKVFDEKEIFDKLYIKYDNKKRKF